MTFPTLPRSPSVLLRRLAAAILAVGLVGPMPVPAAEPGPWKWQAGLVPDAGFDLDTAQVLRVTTLKANGRGSLGDALRAKGPRLIVFEVGGVIDLEQKSLSVREPQVVVAGQTAPAPGITLIRGGLQIYSPQTIVQHLRVRPGDAGQPKKSGWEPDGITTTGGATDVWIDHCSATWSCDENISAATYQSPTGARRIHIRNCIIAEGLSNATHGKGEHSKGTLVYDGTHQVAIVGNLYSSNTERNPVFKFDTSGVVVNNVIANPGARAISASKPEPGDGALPKARIAAVNNLVLFGPNTKKAVAIFDGVAEACFRGNEGYDAQGQPIPALRTPFPTLPEPPLWPEGLEARSTSAALWQVARLAGAWPAQRDAIDTRIVREALTGTSRIIDSQDEVGGYPQLAPTSRPVTVPEKNRRQWLEQLARDAVFGP